jgi:hypothetical protein
MSNVQKNDLKPEVDAAAAQQQLAALVSAFLDLRLAAKIGDGAAPPAASASALQSALQATAELVAPLITAMQQEGHHYLETPCASDYPTNPTCQYPKWPDKSLGPAKGPPSPMPPANCTCGSPWVMQNAQRIMGALDDPAAAAHGAVAGASISTKDSFHDVSDVRPFHLPHIFQPKPGTACSAKDGACEIESTTVSMPIYDAKDGLDTGLYPITASEFRTKLKSRQAVWEKAGAINVDFNVTDKSNMTICRAINQASLDWALAHASPKALSRYNSKGQQYRLADDTYAGIGVTGPTWIKKALIYTVSADQKYVDISAPTFATENKNLGDESYTNTVGYHYCKLLSPARAMEWIYADGLKQFGGL